MGPKRRDCRRSLGLEIRGQMWMVTNRVRFGCRRRQCCSGMHPWPLLVCWPSSSECRRRREQKAVDWAASTSLGGDYVVE